MPGPLNNFQPQVINMTKYVSQIIQIQINKIVQIQNHFSSFYRVILTSYHQRDTLYKPTFCVITFENTDNFKRHLLAKYKYINIYIIILFIFLFFSFYHILGKQIKYHLGIVATRHTFVPAIQDFILSH